MFNRKFSRDSKRTGASRMSAKEITLEMCQDRALGQFLSSWPDNKSYEDIIEALKNDESLEDENEENGIDKWEPFEYDDGERVAELIEDYYDSICRFVGLTT